MAAVGLDEAAVNGPEDEGGFVRLMEREARGECGDGRGLASINQETDPWNPVGGVVRTVHEDKREVRGVSSTARP